LIRIASLLHDIGKPRSYTSEKKGLPFHDHITQTEEIVRHILEQVPESLNTKYDLKRILPGLAAKHHKWKSETILEKLIGEADSIASAADRKYDIKAEFKDGSLHVDSNDKIFPHEFFFNDGDLQCENASEPEIAGYKGEIKKNAKPVLEGKSNLKNLILFRDSVIDGGTIQYMGHHSQIPGEISILALDIMQIQNYIKEAEKLPMLRGGSCIVNQALDNASKLISREVCEEAVLFKGGGNLLALIPSNREIEGKLRNDIERDIHSISRGGLNAAVVTVPVALNDLGGNFKKVLNYVRIEIDLKKNRRRKEKVIKPSKRDDICPFCFIRKAGKYDSDTICRVCAEKKEQGRDIRYGQLNKYLDLELLRRFNLKVPNDNNQIGNSIAVIAIDGNMMGRIFLQTLSPADYNYKSETFDKRFSEIFKKTIDEFIENDDTRNLIENKGFAGIDPLYIGGDDILLIINAKGALKFCEAFTKNVADGFRFSRKFNNGSSFDNPTVTVSCGIAIADAKFPIYFLLEAARKMESEAKSSFRKKTETDSMNLVKIPDGTIAFTAVSGAMPSNDHLCFTLPDHREEFDLLNNIISKSLEEDNRTMISEILRCGKTEIEQLNLIKYLYSSGFRKVKTSELNNWLDTCEWMVRVLRSDELLRSTKMIVPQIWHEGE
ncbi:MAG: HD domain-containing protein, partial [Candidatus Methanoperedenaceae archaeon]|nr:HD domain-containing protein [Candidatus Methanoperedenaceae archaeon]